MSASRNYSSNTQLGVCILAGERGGKLLPKLLKPGELVTKEQKDVFRKENSIDGLGDIGRLIEVIPAAHMHKSYRSSLTLSPDLKYCSYNSAYLV